MVSISFCFKRCVYEVSLSGYGTASKRLGEVLMTTLLPIFSPVFDIISKLLDELPIVC